MTTYLTADTHFGHKLLSKVRGFSCPEEMNEAIINSWNSIINNKDVVWILGDFALDQSASETAEIFARLNGRKRLIVGNHDMSKNKLKTAISSLAWDIPPTHMFSSEHNKQPYTLCHYSMLSWPRQSNRAVHFFGHSHNNRCGAPGSIDVGVDALGYKPIEMSKAINMALQTLENKEELAEKIKCQILYGGPL